MLDGEPAPWTLNQDKGETGLFWQDLSSANMIDGVFPGGGQPALSCAAHTAMSGTTLGYYYPSAKIGNGAYILVYETNNANWFSLQEIDLINGSGGLLSTPVLSVAQTYNIDKKMDDGIATSGNVQANYLSVLNWGLNIATPSVSASPDTSSSCYNASTGLYSLNVNRGSNLNCGFSLRMQGVAR